jgi:hypothetical protein
MFEALVALPQDRSFQIGEGGFSLVALRSAAIRRSARCRDASQSRVLFGIERICPRAPLRDILF